MRPAPWAPRGRSALESTVAAAGAVSGAETWRTAANQTRLPRGPSAGGAAPALPRGAASRPTACAGRPMSRPVRRTLRSPLHRDPSFQHDRSRRWLMTRVGCSVERARDGATKHELSRSTSPTPTRSAVGFGWENHPAARAPISSGRSGFTPRSVSRRPECGSPASAMRCRADPGRWQSSASARGLLGGGEARQNVTETAGDVTSGSRSCRVSHLTQRAASSARLTTKTCGPRRQQATRPARAAGWRGSAADEHVDRYPVGVRSADTRVRRHPGALQPAHQVDVDLQPLPQPPDEHRR